MPSSCSVIGCAERQTAGGLKMFFLPSGCDDRATIQRRRWTSAINRKSLPKKVYVCSKHFISGKPCYDPLDPDFVPSLHMGYSRPLPNSSPMKSPSKQELAWRDRYRRRLMPETSEYRKNDFASESSSSHIISRPNTHSQASDDPGPGKPSSDPDHPDLKPTVRMGYGLCRPAIYSCSFHNCKNVNVNINSSRELRFYPFPTDPALRQTWVRVALRTPPSLEELIAGGRNPLICSDHFFPEDFILCSTGRIELKPMAIPIIFKVTYREEECEPKRKRYGRKMLDPFFEFNLKHCTVAISEEERRLADEVRIIEELETLSEDEIEIKEEPDVDWIENDIPPDNIDQESTDTASSVPDDDDSPDTAPSVPSQNGTSLKATSSDISSPPGSKPSKTSKDKPTERVVIVRSQPRRLVIKEVKEPSTEPILAPVPTGPDHDCYTLPTPGASSKPSQGTVMAPKTLVIRPQAAQPKPKPVYTLAAPSQPLVVQTPVVRRPPGVQPTSLPTQSRAAPPTPVIVRTVLHPPGVQPTPQIIRTQGVPCPPGKRPNSLAALPTPLIVETVPSPPTLPIVPVRAKPPNVIPKDPTKDETFLQSLKRVTLDQLTALHSGVREKVESYAEQVKSLLSHIRLLEDRLSKTTERLSWALSYCRKADDMHPKNENLLVIETVPNCECVKNDKGTDPSYEAPVEDLDDILGDAAVKDVPSVGESQKIMLENERLIKKIAGINKSMKGRRILRVVVIQSEDLT